MHRLTEVSPNPYIPLTYMDKHQWIAVCSLALIAALWAIGVVASEPLRHFIQTLPIWSGVALGARKIGLSKWVTLPIFLFWLSLMTCIWLFLLGWAHIISGTFSTAEIALTLIVGIVSVVGVVSCIRLKSSTHPLAAIAVFLLSALVQVGAIAVSLRPEIAHH